MRTPLMLLGVLLVPTGTQAQAPAAPAKPPAPATAPKPLAPSGKTTPAPPFKATGIYRFGAWNGKPEPRVELNLENATVREALKQIFTQAKQEYRVDEEVPDEPRVTLRTKNVRLSTAVELVLQEVGAAMHLSIQDGKSTIRIIKRGPTTTSSLVPGLSSLAELLSIKRGPDGSIVLPGTLSKFLQANPNLDLSAALPYVLNLQEARATFHCPNCKGQTTVIRRPEQPKCEKCSRTFQPEWQFCPADGTKRPPAASEWRFCPFCGKRVEGEKASSIMTPGRLPTLPASSQPSKLAVPVPVTAAH